MGHPIRTAFILGAGLGTRLRPLTDRCPKPLIPVANKPLITWAFDHLIDVGIERFVVNTHHCAEAYGAAFPGRRYQSVPITFRREPEILETAGGIKNVEDLLGNEPFLVYNGDILTDLPVKPAIERHWTDQNEVTLVLRSKDGPLHVSYASTTRRVTDIGGRLHPETPSGFLFTGVYVISPQFLARIPAGEKISVIPLFREMIVRNARLGGIVIDEGHWWDLGTRQQYLAVHRSLAHSRLNSCPSVSEKAPWVSPSAQIASRARVLGASAVGQGAKIGDDVKLSDSIVWAGAEIAEGSELERCIVTTGRRVSGCYADADL